MAPQDASSLEIEPLVASASAPVKNQARTLQSLLPDFVRQLLHNSVYRTAAIVAGLILAWYTLSTSLSLYNKKLLGKEHGVFGHAAFPAPLLMSAAQFVFQWGISTGVLRAGFAERKQTKPMTWKEWSTVVLSNGVTTGLDIGFSNKSLAYISMSFYTMCKSTTPLFLLLFAFIWRIERPSWRLGGVVAIITGGLVLLVQGEITHQKFHMLGFSLVMMASCLAGFRFTITQVILHGTGDNHPTGSPVEVMQMLMPVMAMSTALLSIFWEQLGVVLPGSSYFSTFGHCMVTLVLISVGALVAFLMVWAEYALIQKTSALTFIVAGTMKEVVTVLAAIIILGESLSVTSALGLVVVIIGVLMFNLIKYDKLKKGEIKAVTMADSPRRAGSQQLSDDLDFELGPESPTARLLAQQHAIQQLPGGIPALASGVVLHHR